MVRHARRSLARRAGIVGVRVVAAEVFVGGVCESRGGVASASERIVRDGVHVASAERGVVERPAPPLPAIGADGHLQIEHRREHHAAAAEIELCAHGHFETVAEVALAVWNELSCAVTCVVRSRVNLLPQRRCGVGICAQHDLRVVAK